jgi:mannose-6-phosphate isomerase-like protein (cupin superfamily)
MSDPAQSPASLPGRTLGSGDHRIVLYQTAEDAQGATILELWEPPGGGASPHLHRLMEESFYVIEGEFEFRRGAETLRGGAGTFVFVPARTFHSFRNTGASSGRLLLICCPPGHERYLREMVKLQEEGVLTDERIAELRSRHDTVSL